MFAGVPSVYAAGREKVQRMTNAARILWIVADLRGYFAVVACSDGVDGPYVGPMVTIVFFIFFVARRHQPVLVST